MGLFSLNRKDMFFEDKVESTLYGLTISGLEITYFSYSAFESMGDPKTAFAAMTYGCSVSCLCGIVALISGGPYNPISP